MKVCEVCGEEIYTRDGNNRCRECDEKQRISSKKKAMRRLRDQAMRDLGLVKVRGALGGTYWE